MGKYEVLYIVHPDLESSIDKILDKVRSIIESRGGRITYEENWGKRKLAYEIRKTNVGIYLLWYFESPTQNLAKIEKDLRLTEEVMRYMILAKPEKIATPKASNKIERPAKKEKKEKTISKPKAKTKDKKPKEESEEERMKKLDEKLGALLGEEEKEKKNKSKKEKK